jgi:hypothetical protein
VAESGKPASHAEAKVFLASFAEAFVFRIAESRELYSLDKERAMHHARERLYDVSASDF